MRSYEEQWTEEEFEKMCQAESPESPKVKEVVEMKCPTNPSSSVVATSNSIAATVNTEPIDMPPPLAPTLPSVESVSLNYYFDDN